MSYSYPSEVFREFDRQADAAAPDALEKLMEAAGSAVAEFAAEYTADGQRPVLIIAGKGNNGGDALVAARLLAPIRQVHLFMTAGESALNRLALLNYRRLPENIAIYSDCTFAAVLSRLRPLRPLIIDGLLGTGFHGTLAPELAAICRAVNASKLPVISIDCPSGLNCTDGTAECCIDADVTITLCAVKNGMLTDTAVPHCGKILVRHLPGDDTINQLPGDCELFDAETAALTLPRCSFDAHKFSRGTVTVIGGSEAYPHAPILSATAALYAGAGLVQLLIPKDAHPCCQIPAALILRHAGKAGHFNDDSIATIENAVARTSIIAAGPGMDRHPESLNVIKYLLNAGKPLILDADALNLLASSPHIAANHDAPLLLTPHEGEAARLLAAINAPSASRRENALTLARFFNATIILKGARTIVASPDGKVSYNMSGCPALATAGAGDVLTGVAAALTAAGLHLYDAARLASFLHGAAAESLSSPAGRFGFIADDLPNAIAQIMRQL